MSGQHAPPSQWTGENLRAIARQRTGENPRVVARQWTGENPRAVRTLQTGENLIAVGTQWMSANLKLKSHAPTCQPLLELEGALDERGQIIMIEEANWGMYLED